MSDLQEQPAKRWELASLEARIQAIEREQEKEDKARSWFWRSVAITALAFIFQVIGLAIGIYVFRRQG